MSILRDWLAERSLRSRASSFARALAAEPSADDVRWLAGTATQDDADHARWELRYLRWAVGILAAESDALDDRTPAAVSHAVLERMRADPNIAADRIQVAEQQFALRLLRYREALREREGTPAAERLAGALLAVASDDRPRAPEAVARGAEVVRTYRQTANEELRRAFGETALPENVVPSALPRRGARR